MYDLQDLMVIICVCSDIVDGGVVNADGIEQLARYLSGEVGVDKVCGMLETLIYDTYFAEGERDRDDEEDYWWYCEMGLGELMHKLCDDKYSNFERAESDGPKAVLEILV